MNETRALDEPLSDAELDELEGFLASDAVPEDCMDLEMLDGFLAAIVSGPETIQPSEWLPQVWSDGGRSATPAYGNSGDAQRIMALILRHMVGIQRTLAESPTRFKPLLYLPEEKKSDDRQPPEGTAWCEGYMAGVKLRDEAWQPLYDAEDARDWIFPIEALAFGDQDPEFAEWIDDKEKRASLVEELAVASGAHLSLLAGAQDDAVARHRRAAHAVGCGAQVARAPALNVADRHQGARLSPGFLLTLGVDAELLTGITRACAAQSGATSERNCTVGSSPISSVTCAARASGDTGWSVIAITLARCLRARSAASITSGV